MLLKTTQCASHAYTSASLTPCRNSGTVTQISLVMTQGCLLEEKVTKLYWHANGITLLVMNQWKTSSLHPPWKNSERSLMAGPLIN